MKRFLLFFVSAIILLSFFSTNAAEKEYHFYIKRGKDHLPPTTDPAFAGVLDKDCFYRDTAADQTGEKRLYLTFDAGYENGNVSKILDVLKEENVPGAFFVLSHFIKSAPELVERMTEEGHLVCNHTANHRNMATLDKEAFRAELEALETVYTARTGKKLAKYYRPPEGSFRLANIEWAKDMGYKTVFWSLAYKDWNDEVAPSPDKAIELLKANTHPGAIVLLHPTSKINADILKEMIGYWKSEGYTLSSLDALGG